MTPKSPVFVVGSPRSGTTVLGYALISVCYHGYGEGHLLSLLNKIAEITDKHYATYSLNNKKLQLFHINNLRLKSELFSIFKKLMTESNPIEPWLDKTPGLEMVRSIPYILELWPNASFIFAKRRAIENIASRMKKFPSNSFEYHCINWSDTMAAWRQIREQYPNFHFIEIDQQLIVRQPKITAAELGSFLSINDADVERISKIFNEARPEQTEDRSANRTLSLETCGWTPENMELFKQLCGKEMSAFGYRTDAAYSNEDLAPADLVEKPDGT